MMRALLALSILTLAACDVPPLTLRYRLTSGPSQVCTSSDGTTVTDCSDYTMLCTGVLSIRIVPPDKTDSPFASSCTVLTSKKLCSIASVDLPQPSGPIPEQVLEVQMAIFEEGSLAKDASGNPICPEVKFGADNLAISSVDCVEGEPCAPQPAIAGRAFYHPGDEKTVIELGCVNNEILAMCDPTATVDVVASVFDFETTVSVSPTTADNLTLAIGEPTFLEFLAGYYLPSANTFALPRTVHDPTPAWGTTLSDPAFMNSVCIRVEEAISATTATLTCASPVPQTKIDLAAYRLPRLTLIQILGALGLSEVPPQGLTVGIVLNQFFTPVQGAVVTTDTGTIKYLSADRGSVTTTSTSSNGIFVSSDATFGSMFRWNGQEAVGGGVGDHVTIVVLRQPIEPM